MSTIVHVTHEAVEKIGGIGAVLQGLLTSRKYDEAVGRSILVGPLFHWTPSSQRLGKGGEILFSSIDGVHRAAESWALREIERRFNVSIVYGRRVFEDKDMGVTARPEVLLIETYQADQQMENALKFKLWQRFGLASDRYESIGDYEQYLRIAETAYEALKVLLGQHGPWPCHVISHEYMGMPLVLKALLEGDERFRTIFYAHEVATVRPIVEGHPGHDTMFYNVLEAAMREGRCLEDVFGPQDHYYKHALISRARHCHNIFAVGDYVVKELQFLGLDSGRANVDLVYNGVPAFRISLAEKTKSKSRLQRYAKALLGFTPDYVLTHVTRLVLSKGLWRDFRVLEHLDRLLAEKGLKGVLFILSSQGGQRRPEDVRQMEANYGWPMEHKLGYPDLVHDEAFFDVGVKAYNKIAKAIKIVFVNQFGWSQELCGHRMPAGSEFMDIRKGSDVEFGQSIYEPFGIAQLEPLSFGALCVISNVCGCAGFVRRVAEQIGAADGRNVIVADYVRLPQGQASLEKLRQLGMKERDAIEEKNSRSVAAEILARLPKTPAEMEHLIESGHALAEHMSWDAVVENYFLPGLARAGR